MTGWSALLGALGLVALSFGLLSALLAVFQPTADLGYFGWVWANLVIGFVLVGASLVSGFDTLRERMRSREGRRASRYGTSAVLSTLLGILILCMLAFLSTRYSKRFDWSEQGIHTLTEQTVSVLSELDEEVVFTAFFNQLDAPPVRELLDRYAYENDRVRVEFADPNQRPDLVEALGIDEQDLVRGLMRVAVGEESMDLKDFDESTLTNALVKLTRRGDKKVYFLEGHNERPIGGEQGNGKEGYSRAADALRNESYEVDKLLLAATGEVPEDADVVVIAGPTRPMLPAETEALVRWVEAGGALIVLLDPRANTDFYDTLALWGVDLGDDVIVDQQLALFGQATSPFASDYSPSHPITQHMRETALFPMARSVSASGDLEAIVFTGKSSWAERDLETWRATGRAVYDEADLLGPVPVAVAGTLRVTANDGDSDAEQPKLVVYGDSDFATNEVLDSFRNRDLFVNSINWLMGDVEHITIRPNQSRASRFQLSADEYRTIQYLSLFVLPEAIMVLGVFAWWLRRARPGS